MLKEYNYIAFDFETTGLDVQKDEPIQLGIVQFSHDGEILKTYTSLIKPKKPIKELKGIVKFLTGFSLHDLQDAPSIETVIEQVRHFFTPETVVVGHNVSFDCAILNKYLPFTPLLQVDTYPLSRKLLHYLPSYALDVIHERLTLNKGLEASSNNSAHDALHDSYMSYDLFMYLMNKTNSLRRKNMMVDFCMQNSDSIFEKLIKRTQKPYDFKEKELFLPALGSTSFTPKKVHNDDPIQFLEQEHQHVGLYRSSIRDLLSRIQRTSKKWIITTTHKSKQRIIERILDELYVTHTTFADQIIFSKEKINAFLHKELFDNDELGFVIKYFSHLDAGHSSVEINTAAEYKIFNALTHRKEKSRLQVTVCTHDQLRRHGNKVDADDTVLFLDHDRWHQTYGNSLKYAIDPYHLLNTIEQVNYALSLSGNSSDTLSTLLDQYSLFVGILSSEINQYFSGFAGNRRDFEGILEDTRLPKTRQALPGVATLLQSVKGEIPEEDFEKLNKQYTKFYEYLSGECTIEKRMYNGDKWWYVLHRRNVFVDYSEFIDSLPQANYIFCTTNTEKNPEMHITKKTPKEGSKQHIIQLSTTPSPKQFLQKLGSFEEKINHFVLSTSKQQSKELFDKLVAQGLHHDWTIVAENITGGVGKNVFHAIQSKKPVLCIGGYAFYLELLSKKFAFSHVFLYHLFGSMKHQIVTDLIRYGS